MNLAEHELFLRNTTGDLLDVIGDGRFASLTYGLKENEPGVLELILPGDYNIYNLMIDGQIDIYRAYGGGTMRLEGDTSWFIRKIRRMTTAEGTKVIAVTAYSAMDLLLRRVIPYYAGTSYTDKVGMPWDDMLKEIVYENYGPGASYAGASYGDDPDRNLEPWLVVEPYFHYGASFITTHSFPWRVVLNVLQDIVNDTKTNGTYCTFDVIRISPAHYEFVVFVGPRGANHSASSGNAVIVSEDRYNLAEPALEYDWQGEHNFIYGLGQGQETSRVIETAQDNERLNISPFNRQEFNQDARQAQLSDSVRAAARAALEEFRPKIVFTGKITQTEGCIYGVHWGWGDIVVAEYLGASFDCYVKSIVVSIDGNGTEMVEGNLRSANDLGI